MPMKTVKFTGVKGSSTIKACQLPNGNLVIPARMPHNRELCEWIEVRPGTSEHKRWLPVAVDEPDPRQHPDEQKRMATIHATEEYKNWASQQSSK